ncbi:MAG: hypothetical protein FWF60_02220 [Oscillospiraceae bacterium]|nr:hypothetical protein [Oscillospiraceae bacterium]
MEINIPFDSSEQTMELIKLAALYYDRVNIMCPEHPQKSCQFYSQELFGSINILQESKIVIKKGIEIGIPSSSQGNRSEVFSITIDEDKARLIAADTQLISGYKNSFSHSNAYAIFADELFTLDKNDFVTTNLFLLFPEVRGLILHCFFQLCMLYNLTCGNKNCISSDEYLGRWLGQLLQESGKLNQLEGTSRELMTLGITPILLPDFRKLSCEDILEMRLKASDELLELRCYLSELSSKYDADDKQLATVKDFIERDINRAVKDFESKVHGFKVGTIQRALKSMANPLSYAPMLTTFIKEVPVWVAAGLSMGIITAEAALEYSKQKKELMTDPLYFTVKLNKYGKGKGKKA